MKFNVEYIEVFLPRCTLDITRVESESGVQQIRRNQATAVILLGVVGAEFPDEMMKVCYCIHSFHIIWPQRFYVAVIRVEWLNIHD